MFAAPHVLGPSQNSAKTVLIPLLWKDLQVCILTNSMRNLEPIFCWGYAARWSWPKRFRWRDGQWTSFFDTSNWDMLAEQLHVFGWRCILFCWCIFCSLVFFSMVFGGCVCICVGLHLEPTAFYPLWEGIYTCFWDRCRVRGREGTAFPFPIVKPLISPALVHFLAGKRRPWWKQWEEWGRFLSSIWDMDVRCHRWHPSRCSVEGPKCAVCRRHRPENCFSKAVDTSNCTLFVLWLVCKFDRMWLKIVRLYVSPSFLLYFTISETLIPGAADQAPQDCRLLRESHQKCFL